MTHFRAFAGVLLAALPAFSQYAGPAVLSRGDAPTGMASPQLSFRPFLEVAGVYNTGLAGVGLTPEGELANTSAAGVELSWGISGSHSWRHTQVGLDYRGDLRHYNKSSYFDGTDQSMMLGIKHQFTRHVSLNLRETAGLFNRDPGLLSLSQAIPFDASQSYVPITDFFDNRTIYVTSQADLTYQRSARMSFNFGGDAFLNRRRSTALAGVKGAAARADMQYRLTRRTTVGLNYLYTHFSFNHIFGATDIHGVTGSFGMLLSRNVEVSGYAGFMRLENKFIQTVAVDPVVAAIIGITQGTQIVYGIQYVPNVSARISRKFQRGVLYASGGHSVTPGNGLFLTSVMTTVDTGYAYTGLRQWSFNADAGIQRGDSVGNVVGNYNNASAGFSISRRIGPSLHAISTFHVRKYDSPDFSKYSRLIYESRIGIGFTPGDVPLRIW